MPSGHAETLEQGREALRRGEWAEARRRFERALADDESAEAYEGLGVAARYALDPGTAFEAHERGYQLARARGDDASAARLAVQLGYDAYSFRGPAEAQGWVERAGMLVDGRPPSAASATIAMMRAHLGLLADHDPDAAVGLADRAVAEAREARAVNVEMQALALGGLARASRGQIDAGMRALDAAAAAAVGGEMSDVDSIESVCCYLIDACRRVRDVERAREWCERVRDIATRYDDRQMFSVCRTYYAEVLMWQGDVEHATAELTVAASELASIRPGREADPLVRLAELRRRQGRTAEAEALLAKTGTHRLRPLVEGELALDRGQPQAALEAAQRFLRLIGEGDRFERVAGLELAVRAGVASGDDFAEQAASELAAIAEATPTPPLRAAARLGEGRVAASRGDLDAARALVQEAADVLAQVGARYDAAVAELELASILDLDGRAGAADEIRNRARRTLEAMGSRPPEGRPGGLSPREAEVLRLVAKGMSNEDIAHELFLSVRTVERHVANTYAKIGASGRTARAIATAWAHAHGIA
jgi:ATP/maltotriose-dependent transcriptional regulator MalT